MTYYADYSINGEELVPFIAEELKASGVSEQDMEERIHYVLDKLFDAMNDEIGVMTHHYVELFISDRFTRETAENQ